VTDVITECPTETQVIHYCVCIFQEDGTKPAASTYLIDQMEYPYPYPTYEMQHQPKPHHDEQDVRNTYNHGVDGKYCGVLAVSEGNLPND
jgi:hypothetical protein